MGLKNKRDRWHQPVCRQRKGLHPDKRLQRQTFSFCAITCTMNNQECVYWESKQYKLWFHVVFISRNIVLWICCLSFMLRQFGLLWLEVRFTTIAVHGAQHAGALDLNDCDPSWAVLWECQRPFKKPTPFFLTMDVSRSLSLFFFSVVKGMARTTKGNAGFMKGRLGNAEGSWKTTQGDMWPIWSKGWPWLKWAGVRRRIVMWVGLQPGTGSPHQYSGHITAESTRERESKKEGEREMETERKRKEGGRKGKRCVVH